MKATVFISEKELKDTLTRDWAPLGSHSPVRVRELYISSSGGWIDFTDEPEPPASTPPVIPETPSSDDKIPF